MKIPNPTTKKFRISYLGEFLGDFIRTFNLDLFDRGVARVGDKVYPHTTGIFSSDFENARLDNGATGATGPTGLTDKLWTVSESGVFHSYQGETFQAGPTGPTFVDSELIAVADETEEDIETLSVDITVGTDGNLIVDGLGNTVKGAQSFKAGGPVKTIKINASKVGSPTDDLDISIQGDDDGKPDGVVLATKSIDPTDIGTMKEFEIDISEFTPDSLNLSTNTYWMVFERTDSSDTDYYILRLLLGGTFDSYTRGEYKSFDGTNWNSYGENTETSLNLPTANNTVTGATGWSDAERAQEEITDSWYAFATPPDGVIYSHAWHTFGFTIPADAIISGVQVQIRASVSSPAGGERISVGLTKDADAVSGTTKSNPITTTVTTTTHGSSTDLWGTTLTPAEVNSDDFGLRLSTIAGFASASFRCMWMRVRIYYYIENEEQFMDAKMSLSSTFPASPERLYATTNDDVVFLNEEKGIWQSLWKGILQKEPLNENYPSVMKNIGAGGTLILGNDNKIHTMTATANNPNESEENKLIFDHTHFVNWIAVTSSAIFIGLQHKRSELLPSQICHYEPFAERTRIFTIKEGATIGFTKDENCQIIDKSGQLRVFNGAYFQPYLYFPPYHRNEKITLPHRNGIKVKDNIINFLWEGQYPDPSGIWVLEDGNLYHKHSLVFDTLKSFGSLESTLRALYQEDDIYLGGKVQNASGGQLEGVYSSLNSVDDSKRGQLVTSKMTSPEIDSIWQEMSIRFKDGDFVVKQKEPAKITEGTGATAFNGEWTSATTFTCSDAGFVSAVDDSKIEIGDEVIVRKGASSGLLAHITNITGTTTKTVTIDSGLATSGTFTFSIENWAKIPVPFRTGKLSSRASLKDERSESKQLKIDMRGTLEELEVKSIPDNSLKVK